MVPSFAIGGTLGMKRISFIFLIYFLSSLWACETTEGESPVLWNDSVFPKVFFSYPGRYVPEGKKRNVRDEILKIVRDTKHHIYMHIYSFQDEELENELMEARKRGVQLEFLGEWGKEYPESILPYLRYWKGTGLQHTKVLVSDHRLVFLGTGNFTYYGLERDLNGYLEFPLQEVEKDKFRAFLEEEYVFPSLQIGAMEFRNSPIDGQFIQNRFLSSVDSSLAKIDYLIFDHYDPVLSIGMSASSAASVRGIYDRPVDPEGKILSIQNKFQIYEDGNEDKLDDLGPGKGGLLHHKSMIFDDKELLTGSFNFSASARDSNREISVRTQNERVVKEFEKEFGRVLKHANPIFDSGYESISVFSLDALSASICRTGVDQEEVLLVAGKSWYEWRNFYRFSENEICKSISDYETISSRYFGGKSEFLKEEIGSLGYRLLDRYGKTLLDSSESVEMETFFFSLNKPAAFLSPSIFIWNEGAWVFPENSFWEDGIPLRSWILERGKLPKKIEISKEGAVFYFSEDLNSQTGLVLMEYENFNLYFCYKEPGNSLHWTEEILFAVLEKSEVFSGVKNYKKIVLDFFGKLGDTNRRKENLCTPTF